MKIFILVIVLVGSIWCDKEEDIERVVAKEPPYIAHMKSGDVEGYKATSPSGRSYYGFKGIPYAYPPKGNLRFKPPEAHLGWNGTRDAKTFGSPCPQFDIEKYFRIGIISYLGDEDCLFLNIYTPEFDGDIADLPVLVLFPGISYVSDNSRYYDPGYFMEENVVLVVLQYRLGILGFLSTEDLVIPGNFGLMDQTLALRWIDKNIHHFGGNNLRKTIFGHGSGSASVHLQMLSHQTIGLFQRAILQSGNALCPWAMGAVHRRAAFYLGQHFNCTSDVDTDNATGEDDNSSDDSVDSSKDSEEEFVEDIVAEDNKETRSEQLLECLQNVDVANLTLMITEYYAWGGLPIIFGPRVDGRYLPDTPEQLLKDKRHKRCDIMMGIVKDEGSVISNVMFANEGLRVGLKYNFPIFAPISLEFTEEDIAPVNMSIKAYDYYVGGLDIERKDVYNLTKMYGDRHQAVCTDLAAMFHHENNLSYKKNVFLYELHYRGEHSMGTGFNLNFGSEWTGHGDDILHLFADTRRPLSEVDDKVSRLMIKMWTNFAATGNPTPEDIGFTWTPFTKQNTKHLVILPEPYMAEDTREEIRDFWTSLPTIQNMFLFPERVKNLNINENPEVVDTSSEVDISSEVDTPSEVEQKGNESDSSRDRENASNSENVEKISDKDKIVNKDEL